MEEKIAKLQEMIDKSERIVFFGGAGVSTESNIPDFRSVDGLYNQQYKYPPETILSHSFFVRNPEEFYRFYRNKMIITDALPNKAHLKLAELEKAGKLTAIVTQNIDGLHQKAGNKKVYELHGTIWKNHCIRCNEYYDLEDILGKENVPKCQCGGIIKPDVVLYEESLDSWILSKSIQAIKEADMLIIGGTSLAVYPAAGLIDYYSGDRLVLINKSSTGREEKANLVINDSIGKVFEKISVNS